MKMAKERVKNQRRANSVGGAELQSLLKDSRNGLNTTLQVGAMTSRRNAVGGDNECRSSRRER